MCYLKSNEIFIPKNKLGYKLCFYDACRWFDTLSNKKFALASERYKPGYQRSETVVK